MSEPKRGFVNVPAEVDGRVVMTMKTKCNGCVFAQDLTGIAGFRTQLDCRLGRIEKFRERGTTVSNELTEDTHYSFLVIEGRACNALRYPEAWPEGANLSPEVQVTQVKKEISITAELLVLITKKSTLEDVYKSVQDVYDMRYKPTVLHLINNSPIPTPDIINLVKSHPYNEEYMWRVHNMRKGGKNFGTKDECIEFVVHNVEARYYCVFDAGYHIPDNYLERINNALVEELERFSVLESDNYPNGIFVAADLHRHSVIAGNAKVVYTHQESGEQITCNNVIDKVKFIAEADNKEYMVRNVKDFVYV